jgi:hypothetical protein
MSKTAPIVKRASTWASCSAERPLANPPAIISKPSRLSGRRNHATRPARMYGTVIQSSRATDTRSTSSFVTATAIERSGATQPTPAIAPSTNRFGVRISRRGAIAAVEAILAPFYCLPSLESHDIAAGR